MDWKILSTYVYFCSQCDRGSVVKYNFVHLIIVFFSTFSGEKKNYRDVVLLLDLFFKYFVVILITDMTRVAFPIVWVFQIE